VKLSVGDDGQLQLVDLKELVLREADILTIEDEVRQRLVGEFGDLLLVELHDVETRVAVAFVGHTPEDEQLLADEAALEGVPAECGLDA